MVRRVWGQRELMETKWVEVGLCDVLGMVKEMVEGVVVGN